MSKFARHVIRALFSSARELEGLIPLLKEHCDAEDYAVYGKGIAMALAAMSTELTEKMLAAHPELTAEIDADVTKYGRYLQGPAVEGKVIAQRLLKLRRGNLELDVPVSVFAPEHAENDWICRFEIGWPEGVYQGWAAGFDAMQALVMAMQMIGATLYASEYHKAGLLMWEKPGNGYGFPLPQNARDWLEGDDARFF